MNNKDKIKDFQEWLTKMTEEFSEFTKPDEPEFKEGDWLELSDYMSFDVTQFSKLTSIVPENSNAFRASNGVYFKYARRPYDRIIPHDGGEMPEWVRGKYVTVWFMSGHCVNGQPDKVRNWSEVKEYRVHKEEV